MPWLLQHSMMRQGSNTSCYILNHLHTIWPKHRSLVKYLIHLLRKTSGTRLGSATEKNAIRCSILFWWCNLLPLYNSEDQRISQQFNSGKWSHVFSENVWIVVWGVTMANSFLLQEAEINFHITALPPFTFIVCTNMLNHLLHKVGTLRLLLFVRCNDVSKPLSRNPSYSCNASLVLVFHDSHVW